MSFKMKWKYSLRVNFDIVVVKTHSKGSVVETGTAGIKSVSIALVLEVMLQIVLAVFQLAEVSFVILY